MGFDTIEINLVKFCFAILICMDLIAATRQEGGLVFFYLDFLAEFESGTPKCGFSMGRADSAQPRCTQGKQGPWAIGLIT